MLPEVEESAFNIRTFHSFGVWLLRRFSQEAGLQPGFTIYDDSDSISFVKKVFTLQEQEKKLTPIMKCISKAKRSRFNTFFIKFSRNK